MADVDQRELVNVIGKYLELVQLDYGQFNLYMASNSVVDWFGRQLRGPIRIHDYLSTGVVTQYEHKGFDKVEVCSAIEYKPTHHKTKSSPTGDVDWVRAKNRVSGISTLKTYADSDLDDDDDMVLLPDLERTPEKGGNSIIEELTPPSSTIKLADQSAIESDDDEDDGCAATKAKRLKHTHPSEFSYLRRMPAAGRSIKVKKRKWDADEVRPLFDDASSSDDDGNATQEVQKEYSHLCYLEATGVLRSLANRASTRDEASTWERPVRIRMSYRRKLIDQQLQFALILYEHIEKQPISAIRRNLMSEFSEVETELADVADGDADELPVLVLNEADESAGSTAAATNLGEVASTLESTAFPIVTGLRTPTKSSHTPPATPKRRPRLPYAMSGMKRLNLSPSSSTSAPKRTALRHLRL